MAEEEPSAMTIGDSSQRDALAEGILGLLRPAVAEMDTRVATVRESQQELRSYIDTLAEELKQLSAMQALPVDLEPYVKKLANARRRVALIVSLMQTVQDRLTRVQQGVAKETSRRKALAAVQPS
ncbi:SNARE-associated protein Snapin-like [Sycon ciliatum]|uniref:SNARE-associated protein Snapin-like n=1 Tax=Sycon ciliatum TaxID=27933 RepID=UPI0031F5F203